MLENVVNTIGHLWKRKIIKIDLTQDGASRATLEPGTKTQQNGDNHKPRFHDKVKSFE